jgi:hypothetical protein
MVAFRVVRSDLPNWLSEVLPVILVVYDVTADLAYWIHVQGYFRALPRFNLFQAGQTVTVRLPRQQVLNPSAVRQFAALRDQAYAQFQGADPS